MYIESYEADKNRTINKYELMKLLPEYKETFPYLKEVDYYKEQNSYYTPSITSRELKLDLENAKSKIREKNTSVQKKIQRNWLEDRLDKETLSKLENIRRNR
jgi:hypothetical protein